MYLDRLGVYIPLNDEMKGINVNRSPFYSSSDNSVFGIGGIIGRCSAGVFFFVYFEDRPLQNFVVWSVREHAY